MSFWTRALVGMSPEDRQRLCEGAIRLLREEGYGVVKLDGREFIEALGRLQNRMLVEFGTMHCGDAALGSVLIAALNTGDAG
jgi:hypothetical protein